MAEFADAAQQTLADDFSALGPRDAADIAMMLWGIINTQLTAAILGELRAESASEALWAGAGTG